MRRHGGGLESVGLSSSILGWLFILSIPVALVAMFLVYRYTKRKFIYRKYVSLSLLILGIAEIIVSLLLTLGYVGLEGIVEISRVTLIDYHVILGSAIIMLLGVHLGLNFDFIKKYFSIK